MIVYFGIENSLLNWDYNTEMITDQITFSSKENVWTPFSQIRIRLCLFSLKSFKFSSEKKQELL